MGVLEDYRRALRFGDLEAAANLETRLGLRPGAELRGRLSPLDLRRFITSGKAVFTVVNLSTTPAFRRTYRVRYTARSAVYYVDALYGPDNHTDYTPVGVMRPTDGVLTLTVARPIRSVDYITTFEALHAHLKLGTRYDVPFLPRGWAAYHEGRCGRCCRRLTVPESITAGIGPDCRGVMETTGVWTRPGPLIASDTLTDLPLPLPPPDKPWLRGLLE